MVNLPKITDVNLSRKRVIVRADLDLPAGRQVSTDDYRLEALLPTLKYLASQNCVITLIGHRGRPNSAEASMGEPDESFSLKPVEEKLRVLASGINFVTLENLRFDPGEEANDPTFAQKLTINQDFYVNDAFAASHREHASIVGLPKLLPHAAGIRFVEEVVNLSKVLENPARPLVAVIGGIKKDKLNYLEALAKIGDKVLVGGRLPDYLGDRTSDEKLIIGKLTPDKEDLTVHSIESFKEIISNAKTIILAGAMGKFEDEGHRQGTKEVFTAISNASGFKIAGGGDTLTAIKLLNLESGFSWLSVGGGASLEFICKGTLPGIEALK